MSSRLLLALLALGSGCRQQAEAPAPAPAKTTPPPPAAPAPAAPAPAAPAAPVEDPPAPEGTALALLYSSNMRGEYERCGCPSHPLGGLGRRATLTDRTRAEVAAILQVDAGDLLLPRRRALEGFLPPAPEEIDRRARLLLTGMARIGLHAFTPGENDLQLGVDKLRRLAKEAKAPIIAANLTDAAGKPLFDADRLVELAKVKVGLFGLLSLPAEETDVLGKAGVTIADPVAAARAAVTSLRGRGAQLVVGLLHLGGGAEEAKKLLGQVEGVDFAVLGHVGAGLQTPAPAGRTRLVEAYDMGKHLGRLDLHVVDGKLDFSDRGLRPQLRLEIEQHRREIEDYRKRLGDERAAGVRAYFEQQIARAEGAGADKSRRLAALPAKIEGSWFSNRIFELDQSLPDHPALATLVQKYNDETARRAAEGLPVGIEYRAAEVPRPPSAKGTRGAKAGPPEPPPEHWTYGSNGACVLCHKEEDEQWKTTAHAHALETLRKKGRDQDPDCLGCHTTGFMRPGGTRFIKTAATYFANVGCESCHGPSVEHVRAQDKKSGTRLAAADSVCRECHTADQVNGEFDYARYLQAILGPGHGR